MAVLSPQFLSFQRLKYLFPNAISLSVLIFALDASDKFFRKCTIYQ